MSYAQINKTPVNGATGAASTAEIALPFNDYGKPAHLLHIVVDKACYIRFGVTGMAAASSADLLLAAGENNFVNPQGALTHFRIIDGPVAVSTYSVQAVENIIG